MSHGFPSSGPSRVRTTSLTTTPVWSRVQGRSDGSSLYWNEHSMLEGAGRREGDRER